MNKRVNEIRRVILALCFFGLVLSLIGTELPWVKITQSKPQNPLYIVDKPTCNITKVPELNGSYPNVVTAEFTLDVYMTLTAAQLCQSFVSGQLPPYIGGAVLTDIRMCSDIGFDQMSNFMQDVSQWDSYSADCGSSGAGTMFLIIAALIIMTVTMLINTFPKMVQKCCDDQNSFKNKFIRSFISFLAPAFVTLALIIYSMQCVNGDLGDVLTKTKMARSGTGGYWLCCISCALLWIYWGLFIFRMCDNSVQIDFKGASDIKAKFLNKNRKESDVDAGMIDESEEQRETMGGGGAYNDNDTYREYEDNNDQNRKHTISAYDDDGIGGPQGHAPSAGSWQDVEED